MNQPFWLQWEVGQRVVVRHRIADGRLTDALGHLQRVDATGVEVVTKRGVVSIPAEAIMIGKLVPPAPQRPRRD